jgi:hypothetical protein
MESTLISAENANVFVDKYDDGVWLSIQTMQGGAHCVIKPDQVKTMIVAMQNILESKND